MQHSLLELCQGKNHDVPSIEYNFTKVSDIQDVTDKEKIDILVIVTQVHPCVNQSLRSGRDTKKREVTVTDDSKAEIMMTLWGDNAVKYDQNAIEGKVLAVRSVMVTDWNGKSLSCTFGSSIEVEPDIPEAEAIKEFYQSGQAGQVQSLSNDRLKPNIEGGFVSLKQIQDDFQV